ncbi:MAG: hypothetical protein A3A96_01875 [Candidatus Zambryskibacteria bacterium RIFCSPLOWO2_01_FULL_39_39]|uniref:Queuine tRNA-ribosyltransferase n=1 Tax=Candidatus Zambryskibacteria bacterium RIFCSPLOWO2_01_FULL_39_39 TaxID=1802758 RepID=A0A1G2TVW0_9BACT|nr:MAG: Queuine tRNA-ribosyltransferase [Parcubacteria group bacterium GW2011_GWA1_38_7]OHA86600.1 MAG: hypothetical protein A2644_01990 [Candidatus Zambryskibacteria bacterium RIFCSPHIGHO2_01_FULL_39_63]OHA94231.1 MAG: hypothetical protein A3B88_03725 [Candidatus Zambryskibacteria bacterium RIFCSPHIGHO2_02_FULL_39_19]OHA98502.1 MAG: hypothetical protein A3F20_03770 [Candidatus Zambryskibacteria bacterium RIFCSPHIGHO2_12_FULL_39_21]OHB01421.1 MAG: hypothetical protein A3A96_01875 [Candidatus Za
MFKIEQKISKSLGRAGVLITPHGEVQTPSFVAVGTKATVKSLSPEQVKEAGSQIVLANTYHLYLEPGEKIVKEAGGLGKFMNWQGPTMTDSGGFQAFSLGVAYGSKLSKFIGNESPKQEEIDEAYREERDKKAKITEDGVEFKSIIDGSKHFFTPEKSMQIQSDLGADIIFAFDECTSPHAPKEYLKEALARTHRWAERCLIEYRKNHPTPTLPEGEGAQRGTFGYHTTDSVTWKNLQQRVLEMREKPTPAENMLWQHLRKNSTKYHFRRQHIVGNFIVDFVCLEKSLVIEVDGDIHDYQKEEDKSRTEFLNKLGFYILRFKNEEVVENILKVLEGIKVGLKALPFGEGLGGVSSQALFGIVQGGRYEDLRKESAKVIGEMDFDGFGIGGSFVKEDMATAVKWVSGILPTDKPRHLLGVGEPVDIIFGVENGCDTFDCVAATRMARNGTLYTKRGKININNAKYKNIFEPIEEGCKCYTCKNYTCCYLSHLFRSKEMLAATLASIHNLYFINSLVAEMRESILNENFFDFKENFLRDYKV